MARRISNVRPPHRRCQTILPAKPFRNMIVGRSAYARSLLGEGENRSFSLKIHEIPQAF